MSENTVLAIDPRKTALLLLHWQNEVVKPAGRPSMAYHHVSISRHNPVLISILSMLLPLISFSVGISSGVKIADEHGQTEPR